VLSFRVERPADQMAHGFIAYAKANPGKIKMTSGGIGTVTYVSGELFKMMAGVDLIHVP
jgi:tripartite-type tricarboxylate transporter receptor subunit TctC